MGQLVGRVKSGVHERGEQTIVPIGVYDVDQPDVEINTSVVVVPRTAGRQELYKAIGEELKHLQSATSIQPLGEAALVARQLAAEGTPLGLPAPPA